MIYKVYNTLDILMIIVLNDSIIKLLAMDIIKYPLQYSTKANTFISVSNLMHIWITNFWFIKIIFYILQ